MNYDVFLFHGGIAKLQNSLGIDSDTGLASTDHFLGCQTKEIPLPMNARLPCPWRRGDVCYKVADRYISIIRDDREIEVAYFSGN
jgi:hypothetical protein